MSPRLSLERVCVARGGRLEDIDWSLEGGRICAVIGPNGAGKSTLLATAAGLLQPAAGRVCISGMPVAELSDSRRARTIAVLGQSQRLNFPLTVRQVVGLGVQPLALPGPLRAARVEAVLQALDLAELAGREITRLSGGEQQRAHLARVLAQIWLESPAQPGSPGAPVEPETDAAGVLLLDEPFASLDPRHQQRLLGVLRRLADCGVAVACVVHDLNLAAALADEVLALKGGRRLVHGPRGRVLQTETLAQVFDVSLPVAQVAGRTVVLPPDAPPRGGKPDP